MADVSKFEIQEAIMEMIKKGFKNTIIQVGIQKKFNQEVSNSRVRSIRVSMENEGLLDEYEYSDSTSGHQQAAEGILTTRNRVIQASLFMNCYLNRCRNREHLDFDDLMKAHDTYLKMITTSLNMHKSEAITINQAYVLATEFREPGGEVQMLKCSDAKCGAPYVMAMKQRMSHRCPLCTLENRKVGDEDAEDIGYLGA